MNILLLGSGGREHAFAHFINKSELCEQLYIAPGNAGTSVCGVNVSLNLGDFEAVWDFCLAKNIDLIVPGNEDPLVAGITDFINHKSETTGKQVLIAGPSRFCAQLEGSKDFSKAFMQKYHIPTARYKTFTKDNITEAKEFIDEMPLPIVLKADGLAAGKGVLIVEDRKEAFDLLENMILKQMFGASSEKVVIEEFLPGIEISVFVVSDGESYKILGSAKDYKRIGVGDTGLNTGGMGAISPVPFADAAFMEKVEERIIKPTIEGLKQEGHPYKGFLFLGLMNNNGEPKVIEYNVRMGDPETEAIFPRLKTDMVELLSAIAQGELDLLNFELDTRTAATVFVVSEGYPGSVEKGLPIQLGFEPHVGSEFVFHAGVTFSDNQLVTNGGRVTAVTVLADSLVEAIRISQERALGIAFQGAYFRTDIGQDLLKYGI